MCLAIRYKVYKKVSLDNFDLLKFSALLLFKIQNFKVFKNKLDLDPWPWVWIEIDHQ